MASIKLFFVALGLLGVMTADVSSDQVARPAISGPSTTSPAFGGKALINGTVVDVNGTPLQNAVVRLRNLTSKQVEQVATANRLGQFALAVRPDVPYVVEIVDGAERILAVGDIIIVQSGDVSTVVISIPTRLPANTGIFTDTVGSVLTAAAGLGLTTLPSAPPLSPER
jgi:hypothetical protein